MIGGLIRRTFAAPGFHIQQSQSHFGRRLLCRFTRGFWRRHLSGWPEASKQPQATPDREIGVERCALFLLRRLEFFAGRFDNQRDSLR